MRKVKAILRWTLGIIIGIYLAISLAMNIPIVQRWAASGVANILSSKLDTEVKIGRLDVGWNGRIILDDVQMKDQEGNPMLDATRMSVRINLWELTKKRIRIGSIQIFGAQLTLSQAEKDGQTNFQFVLDALSKKKKTGKKKKLDLRIGQIVVRHTSVKWDQKWKEQTPGRLDPSHLDIQELNINAQLNKLTKDSISLEIKRFDGRELSGLTIEALQGNLYATDKHICLNDFKLSLPHSNVNIPHLESDIDLDHKSFSNAVLSLQSDIESKDLIAVVPQLSKTNNHLSLNLELEGSLDNMHVKSIKAKENSGFLDLAASGTITNLSKGATQTIVSANIDNLEVDSKLVSSFVQNKIVDQIGKVRVSGPIQWNNPTAKGDLKIETSCGNIAIKGEGSTDGTVNVHLLSEGMQIAKLLDGENKYGLGTIAINADVKGKLMDNLAIKGTLPLLDLKGYPYHNIQLDGGMDNKVCYRGRIEVNDPNIKVDANGLVDIQRHIVQLNADIQRFSPYALNLTKEYADTYFSGGVEANLQGEPWDNMEGTIHVTDLAMITPDDQYKPGDIHINSRPHGDERNIQIVSPFLEAQLCGTFNPKTIIGNLQHMASTYLPTLIEPNEAYSNSDNQGTFTIKIHDAEPLRRLANIPLQINQSVKIDGELDAKSHALRINGYAPSIIYQNEDLKDINLHIVSNQQTLESTIELQRLMKGKYIDLGVRANSEGENLTTRIFWNNQSEPIIAGDINIISHFKKELDGKQSIQAQVLPSNMMIGDSLWNINPGALFYHDGTLVVDSFSIGKGLRKLQVYGRASKESTDTLHAKLYSIPLSYIFTFVNFHAIDFTGEVTGDVYARNLFSKPYVDAFLQVPQFAINDGTLGDLSVYGNWGRRDYSIFLDGIINDADNQSHTLVLGNITPKKDIDYHGIDLSIQAERVNLYFLNKFTRKIFDDLQGRATGWARVFGPFKSVNLEGDVLVNEASVGIPFTGVRYHLQNDSVTMRPGNIYFDNATIYDPLGDPGSEEHFAKVNGTLQHNHFNNLTYDVKLKGENILGYDFKDFGDMPYYGTVYATGDVKIKGDPNSTTIDIKATPLQGTTLTYNASSPDKITQGRFVSYVDRAAKGDSLIIDEPIKQRKASSDLRINFDLDIDNHSTMKLLMDSKAGDMISMNGHGHMLARYYDKGSFQIFGTYRVERGTYGLSLQEIIHKNFDFQNGGTITFTGDPMNADLNMKAIHTVTGVSLNDLSARATFSNTSARVNCVMNVSGKAKQPRITFDFDIPNVNEDEKQMIRSLLSTEEERNMQVVYLLGIGRFYTYDYANATQNQSYAAMNSLLSSTLSGQLNQILNNMIGNSNWNFGANLSTGDMGWSDMDVEGMLQGSLLNNRLLLNGNFGYRDNPVNTSNFIGDFDAQYLLTRSGSVRLKAYSETNDRYFTKSSLTTQGLGFLLKKDFSSWHDLWHRK